MIPNNPTKRSNHPRWQPHCGKLLTMLTAVLVLWTPQLSKAQSCPSNTWPTLPAWETYLTNWAGPSSTTITLTGTSCKVTYWYCTREIWDNTFGPIYLKVIEQVKPDPTSDCSGLAPDDIIKRLYQQILTIGTNNSSGGPPNCTDGTEYDITYAMDCWEEQLDSYNDPYYVSCGDPDNYCETKFEVCKNPDGSYSYTNRVSTSHDNGSCPTLPSPDSWVVGQCYDIVPCGTPR